MLPPISRTRSTRWRQLVSVSDKPRTVNFPEPVAAGLSKPRLPVGDARQRKPCDHQAMLEEARLAAFGAGWRRALCPLGALPPQEMRPKQVHGYANKALGVCKVTCRRRNCGCRIMDVHVKTPAV